jgi:Tfp pilus assembly protein FimT
MGSKYWTADSGCLAARGGQFTAHSQVISRETASGFARNSSFILHPSSFSLHHSAFTLLEVLLTLCLLVIIGAMAWPQLEKTFSYQRLRKAADIVRTQWCKARVEAMRMGAIRVFRYEIEGNKYRIDMLTSDPSALLNGTTVDPASNDSAQSMLANNTGSSQNNSNLNATTGNLNGTPTCLEQTLPKDVFFVSSQTGLGALTGTITNNTSTDNTSSAGDMPSSDAYVASNVASVGSGWSEPIFFYPDGTTSNAQLLLKNKQGRMVELFLRGLTGIVTVSDVTAAGGQGNL